MPISATCGDLLFSSPIYLPMMWRQCEGSIVKGRYELRKQVYTGYTHIHIALQRVLAMGVEKATADYPRSASRRPRDAIGSPSTGSAPNAIFLSLSHHHAVPWIMLLIAPTDRSDRRQPPYTDRNAIAQSWGGPPFSVPGMEYDCSDHAGETTE